MSIVEKAVLWEIEIAQNNIHGYSQQIRWGNSYDCSSIQYAAFHHAGLPLPIGGAQTTRTMLCDFQKVGFRNVISSVDTKTGNGLKRGDVLLNEANHACLYIGNKMVVNARSGEGTCDTADNSGNEIRIQSYWDFNPWNAVLRYPEEDGCTANEQIHEQTYTITPTQPCFYTNVIRMMSPLPLLTKALEREERDDVEALQALLKLRGFLCGDITKHYDEETQKAVSEAQRAYGILDDSECGRDCWEKIITNGK